MSRKNNRAAGSAGASSARISGAASLSEDARVTASPVRPDEVVASSSTEAGRTRTAHQAELDDPRRVEQFDSGLWKGLTIRDLRKWVSDHLEDLTPGQAAEVAEHLQGADSLRRFIPVTTDPAPQRTSPVVPVVAPLDYLASMTWVDSDLFLHTTTGGKADAVRAKKHFQSHILTWRLMNGALLSKAVAFDNADHFDAEQLRVFLVDQSYRSSADRATGLRDLVQPMVKFRDTRLLSDARLFAAVASLHLGLGNVGGRTGDRLSLFDFKKSVLGGSQTLDAALADAKLLDQRELLDLLGSCVSALTLVLHEGLERALESARFWEAVIETLVYAPPVVVLNEFRLALSEAANDMRLDYTPSLPSDERPDLTPFARLVESSSLSVPPAEGLEGDEIPLRADPHPFFVFRSRERLLTWLVDRLVAGITYDSSRSARWQRADWEHVAVVGLMDGRRSSLNPPPVVRSDSDAGSRVNRPCSYRFLGVHRPELGFSCDRVCGVLESQCKFSHDVEDFGAHVSAVRTSIDNARPLSRLHTRKDEVLAALNK